MRLALLGVMFALAGCAGQPVEPPEPVIVRVEVPIPIPCETEQVAVPAWAASGLKKADSLEVKVRALAAERCRALSADWLRAGVARCERAVPLSNAVIKLALPSQSSPYRHKKGTFDNR